MWISREEASARLDDDRFRAFCRRHHAGELEGVERALASKHREWMGRLGLQQLAASFARTNHPARLGEVLLRGHTETGEELRTLLGVEFVEPVVAVAEAHGWDRARLRDDELLRERELGGKVVCLRFVAQLLRLGDLLDLGEGRVSRLLWEYLRPLDSTSEAHWRKEATLKVNLCGCDSIEIRGAFDIDNRGIQEAESYRLALDWLGWLRDEIESAIVLCARLDERFRERCCLGKLELDTTRVKATGLELEGTVSFELDRERIMLILGEHIYSQGSVFVRELLQNAIDATRAQMVRDHVNSIASDPERFPRDRPWAWPAEITGDEAYMINVETGKEVIDGCDYETYSIADRGIGMTLEQVRRHFLQIGRSYHKSNQCLSEFSHPAISQFGIGFLSCLSVADHVEVVTRPRGESAGLRLTTHSPSEHFLVEKDDSAPFGTTVTLKMDPNRPRSRHWDNQPRRGARPSEGPERFGQATVAWGMVMESPLSVNGETHAPIRADVTEAAEGRLKLPFEFSSTTGLVLANGTADFEVLRGLPVTADYSISLEGMIRVVVALRGLFIAEPETEQNSSLLINFERLPRGELTAGRILRNDLSRELRRKIVGKVYNATLAELEARDRSVAALWRLTVLVDAWDAPIRLPCRTNEGVEWVTLGEARQKHSRFLLVPFWLAYRERGSLPLPCVGILGHGAWGSFDQFECETGSCQLVRLGGACTVYLWPPDADADGLELFAGTATHTRNGLVLWRDNAARTEANGHRVQEEILTSSEAAGIEDYDQHGDPWTKHGLSQETVSSVLPHLGDVSAIQYQPHLLHFTLSDADDWE